MKSDNKKYSQSSENSEISESLMQELKKQGALDDEMLKVLNENPDAIRAIQVAIQHRQENYDSPFPHPDHLERFNKLYPNAAETVFKEFEKQGAHRREMESIIVDRGTKFDSNAQKYGFYTSIILVGAALFGMYMGWDVLSYGILGFGVAPIVSSYFGKISKRKRSE
ncbi:DUF2335 domain-containing protein [Ignatzschineria larvae DSM 13226]|uniref:DUF2335 domain-containing protein n=1 Tax=Ignatzschineria larvae DSM 13226 TaxID=1111732 RepID=A0ABZ3C195_9GAMM|nr:DUF2335 domain-containing protein [Ignatzschineria larvae]